MSVTELAVLLGQAASGREAAPDDTRDRILDAALAEAAAVGIDRLTMEEVTRRSKLGRMTVYRRFPRRDDLTQAVRLREINRFLQAVATGIDRAKSRRDRVPEAFVAAVTFAQNHPLLRRLAISDPGLALESVAANNNEVLDMGRAFIAREIHGGAPGEPTRHVYWVADVFARLFVTYLGAPPSDPDVDDEVQLRRFAESVLRPMVERALGESDSE